MIVKSYHIGFVAEHEDEDFVVYSIQADTMRFRVYQSPDWTEALTFKQVPGTSEQSSSKWILINDHPDEPVESIEASLYESHPSLKLSSASPDDISPLYDLLSQDYSDTDFTVLSPRQIYYNRSYECCDEIVHRKRYESALFLYFTKDEGPRPPQTEVGAVVELPPHDGDPIQEALLVVNFAD